MAKFKLAVKIGLVTLYILLLQRLPRTLFEKQFDAVQKYFGDDDKNQMSELIIGFPESAVSLNLLQMMSLPCAASTCIRKSLRVDKNLKIEPALAISTGLSIILLGNFVCGRKFFHNGKELTIDDIIFL